jgi:NTE family protein
MLSWNVIHLEGRLLEREAEKKRIAIACQGGGSHTAFTAGALKRLLQDERYNFVALSGTSGGAVCALLAWYALLEPGRDENAASKSASEAARSLEKFWLEDNAARDAPERLLNDWLVGWLRWQQATGFLVESSPNAFSDYWQNRLRLILKKNVPFNRIDKELVKPWSPKLFVGAVNVLTGEFKVFGSHKRQDGADDPAGRPSWVFNPKGEGGIGVDTILASAAIPPVFRSVTVGDGVYWDGLFSQNPPVRELLEVRPDEVWVIQINPSSLAPRPRQPVPGDEPTSVVDIIDRRNELSGNLSLNQELRYVEKMNELVEDLGKEGPEGKRLRVRRGKVYKPVVVRQIEMSRPLGAASKLDRSPPFLREMMCYGERRAEEFFRALAFEEAWASGDADAVLGFFSEDAEIRLSGTPLFRDRTFFRGERQVRDFVRERLAGDVRIDPTKKQVAGDAVTWTVRVSPRLAGEAGDEPSEGRAEAVFEEGRITTLTFAPSKGSAARV